MSFLAPLFLLGALAIAGPILFHLIRRTVRERVQFSTLMFLKPSPPRLTKRSRLENIILLLMRCAVICLLAASFARPYLQRTAAEPPRAASGVRTVILLDTSASMRRAGLWEEAKRAAVEAIRGVDAADALAVFSFDQLPRTLLSFDQWRATAASERSATAIARVESASPTWQGTHIGKALIAGAESILDAGRADAEGTTKSKIILISDLQQGARLDGLQGFDWPRGTEVVLESVGSSLAGNAGVQVLPRAAGQSLAATNANPRIRVVNSAGAKSEQFKVGWAAPNSAAYIGSPIDLHVPGGQNRTASLPAPPTNVTQLSVLLTGDAEEFDNRAFHAAPPRQLLRVTYIGREEMNDPAGELFYVRRAFPDTATLAIRVEARLPGADGPIHANLVIATTVVSDDVQRLQNHLEQGNSLLVIAREGADLSPLAALTGSGAPIIAEAPDAFVLLGQIDFEHPLFTQFRDARYNDFTRIHFWKHRRLDLSAIPKARVVAAFDDKSPALVQFDMPKGALYLMTSGWNPADSQFALSTKFLPFIHSLLEQSSPAHTQTLQLTAGDPIPFPPEFKGESISLTKPDGAGAQWAKGQPFTDTAQPGLYASTQPPLLFAVNLDPMESRTAPLGEEHFAGLGLPLKREEAPVSAEVRQQREQLLLATEQENRQKLWRRLLVAALVILLLETVVAGVSSKRQLAPA